MHACLHVCVTSTHPALVSCVCVCYVDTPLGLVLRRHPPGLACMRVCVCVTSTPPWPGLACPGLIVVSSGLIVVRACMLACMCVCVALVVVRPGWPACLRVCVLRRHTLPSLAVFVFVTSTQPPLAWPACVCACCLYLCLLCVHVLVCYVDSPWPGLAWPR